MAARKKAAKASKASKSKSNPKPSSISKKNTSAKISKPPTRRSNRILMKSKRHEVRLLENGLVDMSETPPWLVHIAERNAKQSPLLRLPGEIRNRIYHYAMTGNVAIVTEDKDRTIVDKKTLEIVERYYKVRAVGIEDGHDLPKELATTRRGKSTFHSTFHLLGVCRQIYTETATLACSGTIFYLKAAVILSEEFYGWWSSTLLPAQRDAITDFAMEEFEFLICLTWGSNPAFWCIFPGIKRLHVYRFDTDYSTLPYSPYQRSIIGYSDAPEKFEEWIQQKVHQGENADVEVIFHPK